MKKAQTIKLLRNNVFYSVNFRKYLSKKILVHSTSLQVSCKVVYSKFAKNVRFHYNLIDNNYQLNCIGVWVWKELH